ncbi:dUTP pyrophosphatase [Raphidocelis subcapitata]|uniref:Deoxyuridine 5'-triphosphate nucleotidohydrolase n=1 Tax=Raphidocelis subcapitata TaxID=307507 RepID=A0A2V0NTR6_9CHLO|nr:dUTP pyrophosphatase [Raphidocelis subcapitata]|eukprot:GBF88225.1 dUTP pyrophosphatase [Raphidocelis subcapitata]
MQVLAAHSENVDPSSTAAMEPPAKQARVAPPQPAAAEESFRVQRISDKASLPTRGSAKAAGYDISSAEDTLVPARGKACISTGLRIAVPAGTYGRVAPRSGLAAKHFIDTGAGVVDEDYRGELKVLLFNHSDADFQVRVGDRIAQLVLERIATPEVEEVASLDDTERGAGGFGSTGVAAAQ